MRRGRRAAVAMVLLGAAAAAAAAEPRADRLAQCAACHGPEGRSATPGTPSLAGQPRLFVENQLVIIREGLREVPAMADLVRGMSDDEISALATYYASRPPRPPAPATLPGRKRAGAELSRRLLCGSCHLGDYSGQQQVPRLAGQDEAYLLQAMKQLRDRPGPGRDTIMAATLRGLSDDDLVNLAHHLAHAAP